MVLATPKETETPVIKLENSSAVLEREMEMMEEEVKAEIKVEDEMMPIASEENRYSI